jgi:uncharacterized phage protein gp47/JayE
MAAPEFTADGIVIQTYEEIYDGLADAFRGIYGADINLDPESPDGQRVGILAKMYLDLQSFAVALVNSFDTDLSEGLALERNIKLTGITKRAGTQSTWDLSVTVNRNVTLDTDYVVEDDQGQQWSPASEANLTSGTTTVTFKAVDFGAVEGLTGATITPVTIELGVTSITAPGDATVGIDEETDPNLRARRNKSLANSAYSVMGKLYTALAGLPNVTDVAAYENDEDTVDVDLGMDPHSVWAVVEGGDVADIVEAIVKNKTAGAKTKGDEVEPYNETLTRPDDTTFVIEHVIRFDRPNTVALTVTANATRTISGEAVDTDAIAEAIAALRFNIGQDVAASALYGAGYSAGTNYFLSDLEISDDGIAFTDGILSAEPDMRYTLDVDDITITEVIP